MSFRWSRGVPTWLAGFGIVVLAAGVCLAGPSSKPEKHAKAKLSLSKPTKYEDEKKVVPQVEVYIPSVARLVEEIQRSRTAKLFQAMSALMPKPVDETGEGFDLQALITLLKKTTTWPDTSVSVFTYTQDREGRPRWMIRLDWPLDKLRRRVDEILKHDAAKKILKDFALKREEDGSYQIELPDTVIAVLRETEGGSLVASTADLKPPEKAFGQKPAGEDSTAKKKTKTSLIYCLLNLEAGSEEERGNSLFSQISGVSDIRYAASVGKDGLWSERFNVRWNPLIGMALKAVFKKASESFDCPKEAFVVAAFHLGLTEGLADSIAGLPAGTIGSRADGEAAISVVPGSGFLPIPDLFYQFHARGREKIIKDIRKAMREDAKKRKEDDRPLAWHEEKIGDRVVFWRDPSADRPGGLSFMNFRTVLFFEKKKDDAGEDEKGNQLIVAQTSTWADDVVHRWDVLCGKQSLRMRMPSSEKVHWQAIIRWKTIYAMLSPYLTLIAGLSEEGGTAPSVEELGDALTDSTIDIRILYSGLDARHNGPLPLGAVYVPAVTAASLSETADPDSESQREQTACRNLRVLHHHATLFKKDYGRWPSTVAELDGYVDFASHPQLLSLRPKDGGFLGGFVSMFTTGKEKKAREEGDLDDDAIDDSLYEIDWSTSDWKLKFRANEFTDYATIYIDTEGEIHRVPKKRSTDETSPEKEIAKAQEKILKRYNQNKFCPN